MIKKIAISISILLYAIVVPFLEINETHVWSPDLTPHFRIHEVWQLATNSAFGIFCFWLVWIKNETQISSIISLIVMGGFLFAYFIRSSYGGSMEFSDGSENTVLGINIGVIGFGIAFLFLFATQFLNDRKKD